MEIVRLLDYTPTERVAYITHRLMEGEELTTAEIASSVGMTWGGAYRMMAKISRVIPVYQEGYIWRILER